RSARRAVPRWTFVPTTRARPVILRAGHADIPLEGGTGKQCVPASASWLPAVHQRCRGVRRGRGRTSSRGAFLPLGPGLFRQHRAAVAYWRDAPNIPEKEHDMADVRPLPGIRYAAMDQLAALVPPPYDVISPEAQTRYYERDPHNIVRLELGREEPGDDDLDNRYTRAAATFADWRRNGVLKQAPPQLYIYEQRFAVAGSRYRRLSLLARVRLEPWEAGVILPHERPLSKPKDDRLKLLRACAA